MRYLLTALMLAAMFPGTGLVPSARAAGYGESPLTPLPGQDSQCGFAQGRDAWRTSTTALVRPTPGPNTIGSAHFLVHYGDLGLSGFAQDISDASELAYRVLVDTIGHLAPPSDGTGGGDARTDVYLRRPEQIGPNIYGRTVIESITGAPYANSATSWIEILDTLGVARRRIVAAHEYYHVIQVGYDRDESVSMLEMLSTWVEDRVYDYHLNLATLQLFFRWPWRGLFSQFYTNSPWAIFMAERHGDAILREALVHAAAVVGPNPQQAFDGALAAEAHTSFLEEFIEFGTFNYFTGDRDDGAHYTHGAIYREVTCEKRSDCYPFPLHMSGQPPAELGTNYYFLDGDGHSDAMSLRVVPDAFATSMVTVMRFRGASRTTATTSYPPSSPEDTITIPDWGACDSVLVVYQVSKGASSNLFGLAASFERSPVPVGAWVLVLDRDGCRAPFDGVDDEYAPRDGEEAPIADALRANGATVVVSDTIPGSFAGCVAVFVVGGFDDSGVTLSTDVLEALQQFIDAGGDVYVEGSGLGGLLSAGDPVQQAFWDRFGVQFAPGAASGNLSTWSAIGLAHDHDFDYDPGNPDSLVGVLVPGSATALVEDGTGTARATVKVTGPSALVMSTVLLGGSTGVGGSTRDAYVGDIIALFDVDLTPLFVASANVTVDGDRAVIEGVLGNYDDEALALSRVDATGVAPVTLSLETVAGEWRFSARDRMPVAEAVYRLTDQTHARVLWEETVRASTPSLALRLDRIYPNPARDAAQLVVESATAVRASVVVYDVAGRRVAEDSAWLTRGANVVVVRTPLRSGLYFVRVEAGANRVSGRFSVIR
jgi:Secretion system C-terminal sorting domain